jgi:hypothetical protein
VSDRTDKSGQVQTSLWGHVTAPAKPKETHSEKALVKARETIGQLKAINRALKHELLHQPSRSLKVIAAPTPATRDECRDGPRPCQAFLCVHHLWRQDEIAGRPWPDGRKPLPTVTPWTSESCAMDIAERYPDGLSRAEVGKALGFCGERARQVEERALEKIRAAKSGEGEGE